METTHRPKTEVLQKIRKSLHEMANGVPELEKFYAEGVKLMEQNPSIAVVTYADFAQRQKGDPKLMATMMMGIAFAVEAAFE